MDLCDLPSLVLHFDLVRNLATFSKVTIKSSQSIIFLCSNVDSVNFDHHENHFLIGTYDQVFDYMHLFDNII